MRAATILCIDDEPLGLQIRKAVLEGVGYKVLTAADGTSGLAIFASHPVDAVLLDYIMPGMDGGEVALNMRSIKPDVPILLHSACVDLPSATLEIVNSSLPKGTGPEALLGRLRELISASQLQEEI